MACQFGNKDAPRNKHNCCMCQPHIELRRCLALEASRLRRERATNPQFEALAAEPGYIEKIRKTPRLRLGPGKSCRYGNASAPRNKRGECMCTEHIEQRRIAYAEDTRRRMANPLYAEKMRAYKAVKARDAAERNRDNPVKRAAKNEAQRRRVARQRQQTPDLSPQEKAVLDAIYVVTAHCNAMLSRLWLGKLPRAERYVVDHIKPLALGGLHHPTNLQIIKEGPNIRKNNRPWGRFISETGRFEFES